MTYGARPVISTPPTAAGTAGVVPAATKGEAGSTHPEHTATLSLPTGTDRAAWNSLLHLSEEQIQCAVIEHLDRRGVKDSNGRKVMYWHPKNGGIHQASARQRMINGRLGVLSGIPDVMLYYAGQLYCLELKTLKGKLTADQQSIGHRFREQGAITGVAFGLFEALAWLERHGLLGGRTI